MNRLNAAGSRLRGSMRARVAIPFLLFSILMFVCLYAFISNTAERSRLETLRSDLEHSANVTALAISAERFDRESRAELTGMLSRYADASDSRMTLIAANGEVLADSHSDASQLLNHNDRPEVSDARLSGSGWDRRQSETEGNENLYVAVPVPNTEGVVLRLAVPTTEIQQTVDSILRAILIAAAVSLAASLAAGWLIAGVLAKPLNNLMRQAMRIAVGDLSARVPTFEVREINGVGRAFNRMADRLAYVLERQDQTSLRLGAVMDGMFDGVVLTDEEGLVLRMNPAAEEMLNTVEADAVGKPFVQASRDYEIARVLNKAFEGKENASDTVDHGIEHSSLLVRARVVQGQQQKLGLVVLHDVTEVRRLETVRREFVANVSHELRTPLTSIRALAETLEAGAIDEREIALDFLGRIVVEIDRLNTLLEDLLDFARLEAGRTPLRLEYASVTHVVESGADRLREQIHRAGLTLTYDIEDDLPEIAMDVNRIEQVLINLIHNAIKFTPSGGLLTIRAWRVKNTVNIAIRDSGVGVPEAEQARLFERFYKSDKARRSEGTGLGLAIAQNIVRLHGGKIWVESTPGEGAEFAFSLPMKRKKAARRARRHTLRGLI